MGGRDRLFGVKTISYESQSYTQLTEQSYRQAPFITAYSHSKGTIDFQRQRLLLDVQLTWPESDPGQFQSSAIIVARHARCCAPREVRRFARIDRDGRFRSLRSRPRTPRACCSLRLLTLAFASRRRK